MKAAMLRVLKYPFYLHEGCLCITRPIGSNYPELPVTGLITGKTINNFHQVVTFIRIGKKRYYDQFLSRRALQKKKNNGNPCECSHICDHVICAWHLVVESRNRNRERCHCHSHPNEPCGHKIKCIRLWREPARTKKRLKWLATFGDTITDSSSESGSNDSRNENFNGQVNDDSNSRDSSLRNRDRMQFESHDPRQRNFNNDRFGGNDGMNRRNRSRSIGASRRSRSNSREQYTDSDKKGKDDRRRRTNFSAETSKLDPSVSVATSELDPPVIDSMSGK
jgi:Zinc-binding loop region of homing endonuclease